MRFIRVSKAAFGTWFLRHASFATYDRVAQSRSSSRLGFFLLQWWWCSQLGGVVLGEASSCSFLGVPCRIWPCLVKGGEEFLDAADVFLHGPPFGVWCIWCHTSWGFATFVSGFTRFPLINRATLLFYMKCRGEGVAQSLSSLRLGFFLLQS